MKLRNKKTGEIIELSVKCENGGELRTFDLSTNTDKPITLAEINEGWEDYEEPRAYWYISDGGEVYGFSDYYVGSEIEEAHREIGNLFETKEEAEKAVEKLKAWKRLKDKGIKIVGWDYSDNVDLNGCKFIDDDFIVGLSAGDIDEEDLDLLFGGEE